MLKKQKEDAEKETEEKVAAAKAPPPGKKAPIKFKDAIGRKYQFPFEMCSKWNVRPPTLPLTDLPLTFAEYGRTYSPSFYARRWTGPTCIRRSL